MWCFNELHSLRALRSSLVVCQEVHFDSSTVAHTSVINVTPLAIAKTLHPNVPSSIPCEHVAQC